MSSFFIRRPIFAISGGLFSPYPAAYFRHRHFHYYRHLGGLIPPLPADCLVSADFAADSQSEYDVHRR